MTLYIGMKFYGHDTHVVAMCLEKKVIFAISTERITRYKHDTIYPIDILEKIFEYIDIKREEVTDIIFCLAEKIYITKLNYSNWYMAII